VFLQIDAFVFEVGDRLPAARSTRLEIDVDFSHRLARNAAKNERPGRPKIARICFAAERGRRSAGSFRESENWRSESGRGIFGLFNSAAMIAEEF